MKTRLSGFFVLAIYTVAFSFSDTSATAALVKPDSDQPGAVSVGFETAVDGNPLEQGDEVYTVQGSYRFFRGDLGVGASLGYAQPSTDLVPGANENLELLLLDFSVIWFANYGKQDDYWRRAEAGGSRLKPELIVFGGPGYASLRLKDEYPGSQFSDAVDDFFTLNAGVGARLYWFQGDDLTTSRWFVQPEVKARWFGGEEGTVDWTAGVFFGVSLGKRPSRRALELTVQENCDWVAETYRTAAGVGERGPEGVRVDCVEALEDRQGLEEMLGYVQLCGSRCEKDLSCLETAMETVSETVSTQGCEGDVD